MVWFLRVFWRGWCWLRDQSRSLPAPVATSGQAIDSLYWTRALGGCHTTRDTEAAVRAAGFQFVWLKHGFHSSPPLMITSAPYILGSAK